MAGLSHSLPDTHKTPLATRSRFGFLQHSPFKPTHTPDWTITCQSLGKAAPQSDPDTIGFLMVYVLKDLKRMAFFGVLQSNGIWLSANCELTSYLQIVILLSEPTGLQDSKSRQTFLVPQNQLRLVLLYLDSVIIYLSVLSILRQKIWWLITLKSNLKTSETFPFSRSGHYSRACRLLTHILIS